VNKEESIKFAQKYLEDILSFFGANINVSSSYDDDVIELSVPSSSLNSILIGRNAETMRSFQYLISTVLRNNNAEMTRVNVDVADYKRQRAERVTKQAREWIEKVRHTGNTYIGSLNAADRRIVHKVASEYSDISTHSEGEGKDRKIIIAQTSS
jgi:spoIIIJ-associated protein